MVFLRNLLSLKRVSVAAQKPKGLRAVHMLFPAAHFVVGLLFAMSGFTLIVLAGIQLWGGIAGDMPFNARLDTVLESLAIITFALAALELSQTIIEEEVQREVHMSAPTRVRRFLSRFMWCWWSR